MLSMSNKQINKGVTGREESFFVKQNLITFEYKAINRLEDIQHRLLATFVSGTINQGKGRGKESVDFELGKVRSDINAFYGQHFVRSDRQELLSGEPLQGSASYRTLKKAPLLDRACYDNVVSISRFNYLSYLSESLSVYDRNIENFQKWISGMSTRLYGPRINFERGYDFLNKLEAYMERDFKDLPVAAYNHLKDKLKLFRTCLDELAREQTPIQLSRVARISQDVQTGSVSRRRSRPTENRMDLVAMQKALGIEPCPPSYEESERAVMARPKDTPPSYDESISSDLLSALTKEAVNEGGSGYESHGDIIMTEELLPFLRDDDASEQALQVYEEPPDYDRYFRRYRFYNDQENNVLVLS